MFPSHPKVPISELAEELLSEVDVSINTSHALIAHGGLSGNSCERVVEGHRSATVRVAVGLSTHEGDGEGNLVLGGAVDGPAAGSESTIPVGDVSNASVVGVAAGAAGGGCVEADGSWGCESASDGKDNHCDNDCEETHDDGLKIVLVTAY